MRPVWKDEDIAKALRKMGKSGPDAAVSERVWFKLEDRILSRRKHFSFVWRPWVHPVRWVAAAACLCMTFTGVLYHQDSVDKNDLAAFLMTVSDPAVNVTRDPGVVHVSVLMSEPADKAPDVLKDQGRIDPLGDDEIFL